ncbi:MAG TPA: PAC2 family protein [Acidimicrobiales bacterium]|jgi:proteasome assembly chaperone (PAC2) family protein|nr:PAC2 family protein [Acidimicrobiales bacterium]
MSLYVVHERPELDRPVLVMAPEGWIDAGLGGGGALGTLLTAIETTVVANFDIDELLDHRARRPTARITDGVYEDLMWPEIELRAGHDASGNAVLLLVGPEPDHQWRAYAAALAEVAQLFDVRMLVGMGAFPAPVPHTRPLSLAATATDAELANRVGVVSGTLEVPAGVLVAVERRFAEAGIPAIGLWARVPHYAAAMPYPEASLLLLQGLADIAGITVDTTPLREAADATRERLDELIANSAEHSALVRQLEARADAEAEPTPEGWGDLPSGDELAAEFERFLQSGEGQ